MNRKAELEIYKPVHRVRVLTATSLFDGHDVAINIMRRMLNDTGAEVIHLGHNRSAIEIVGAAIEEDVNAIAVSSYQGGHIEFFKYIIDLLREKKASHIKVFGGGGGVIVPEEAAELEEYGVTRIYTPDHGTRWGLQGMINNLVEEADFPITGYDRIVIDDLDPENKREVARLITAVESSRENDKKTYDKVINNVKSAAAGKNIPVIGITGTGGAGKSSLIDEVVLRTVHDAVDVHVAVLSCDPSRRKTGGALLGDRIRMNAITSPRVYMRSFATRKSSTEISDSLSDAILVAKAAGFDMVIAETAGTGQGDSDIVDLADISMYVMTSDFGAASQLEKISMLDFADIIVVNKFEKEGSSDALRDVRKQVQRNRRSFDKNPEDMPVFGTIASRFNDDGVTALYQYIMKLIGGRFNRPFESRYPEVEGRESTSKTIIIPPERTRYLSEISDAVRSYHRETEEQAAVVRMKWHMKETRHVLEENNENSVSEMFAVQEKNLDNNLKDETRELIKKWKKTREDYSGKELAYTVRGREVRVPLYHTSLSGSEIPKVVLPSFEDPGEVYTWLRRENLPGNFPYTAGVFPMKRTGEDPTRMFAGEGCPERTNRRFKLLSENFEAKRLSTAFDSVTLYGWDPDTRPDIYGKVGTSGVSVCTLDDVKILYGGFDLTAPTTSVSMTINGPAPIMLAMFLNAAIDQEVDRFTDNNRRSPDEKELFEIRASVLSEIRGTVQADILKEVQGQNTCIFSIDFALRMMGDIQQYFIDNNVKNMYSVSISGYHMAEAGANPITQLAYTLADGFTYVEYYLSRGMPIDSFAPNLSFFFSNGMDPEYTVIGRVARRIWAIAMRELYGGNEQSQRLKYHIQTSGRSLHSSEIQFNDVRTTLQALCAIYDNCNSLHTNAYDEAITTPGEESVRRALAIQQIINSEWGLAKNENPYQGSFIVDELTDLVEEAVLSEFDRLTERGGVLGAIEKGYQRSRIQEESLLYERLKDSGDLPIIGVNTFSRENGDGCEPEMPPELVRSTKEEKERQLTGLRDFQERNRDMSDKALSRLQETALSGGNIFAELMSTVRYCSLGQITQALYDVGGQYRRNM